MSEKNWNKAAGTGRYSSTTTRADGKTTSRQGTVTKTGEGSYTIDGTRSCTESVMVDKPAAAGN